MPTTRRAVMRHSGRRRTMMAGVAIALMAIGAPASLWAAPPAAEASAKPRTHFLLNQGTSSAQARQEAVQSIPFEKLDATARNKAKAVLANVTIFRRLPSKVVDCDPELYLFLVRHPDVVVSMWETLKLSNLQLRQTGPKSFKIVEADGTTGTIEYLHSTHDMQIVYVEGSYKGGLIAKTTKGSGLVILRSGYVREPDGRYYITNRLDAFLSVEPGAVEVVTKTLQPVMTRVAENNFTQTLAFIGSLSRTCEVNPGGVERLAGRLQHLQPEVQQEMVKLAGGVAERAPKAAATSKTAPPAHLPLAAQTVEPPARR